MLSNLLAIYMPAPVRAALLVRNLLRFMKQAVFYANRPILTRDRLLF